MDNSTGTFKLISTPDAAANRSISAPDSAITKRSTGNINRSLLTPCRRIGLGRPSTGSLKKCSLSGMFRSPTVSNENSPVIPKTVDFSPNPINKMLIISPLKTRNTEDTLLYQKSELKSTPVSSKTNGHAANTCNLIRRNLNKQSGIKRCLNDSAESKTNKSILIKEKYSDNNNIENVSNDSVDKDNSVTDECKADLDSGQTHLQESDDKKQKLEITNRTLTDIAERILKKRKQLEDLRIQETYAKKVCILYIYIYYILLF